MPYRVFINLWHSNGQLFHYLNWSKDSNLAEFENHDFPANADGFSDELVVIDVDDDAGVEVLVSLGRLRSPEPV